MTPLRVFFRTESLPPIHAVYAANILQGQPGGRPCQPGPLYIAGFLTEAARASYIARAGFVAVPSAENPAIPERTAA